MERRWQLVFAVTAMSAATALGVSLTRTAQYDASSKLLLHDPTPGAALVSPDRPPPRSDRERTVNTNFELIKLETVAERARTRLRLTAMPVQTLLDQVSTEAQGDSDVVAIRARDPDPARAAAIANAFAEEYVAFRRRLAGARFTDAARLARRRLALLSPEERATPEGGRLEARLRELEISAALQTGGVILLRRAAVPTAAASPRPVFSTVLAAGLGAIVGLMLAFVRGLTDRRLRDVDEVEAAYGAPVLARLPRIRAARPPDPAQRDALTALATSLRFCGVGRSAQVVMVTSAARGEGKTHVALGLGEALTAFGHQVIAIEADLREPGFDGPLGIRTSGGLTAIVARDSTLSAELVEVGDGFSVLPAGPVPPNPQAALGGPVVAAVVEAARARASVVLIDTAPLGVVNDAVSVARLVDGIVLTAGLGTITRDAARRTRRALDGVQAPLFGVAVTNAPGAVTRYGGRGRRSAGDSPATSPALTFGER